MPRNNVPALLTATLRWRAPMLMAAASGMLVAVPAQAASLQQVGSGWANGVPGYVSMYIYVPDKLASPPPIVVASHYCGGNANAMFNNASSIVTVANQRGFIMIFPQTSNNCLDVGSTQSLTHDGGGDTQAIAEMVKYTITDTAQTLARLCDGRLIRRNGDRGPPRCVPRSIQRRCRIFRCAGRMLGRQLQRQQPVEQPLR